MRKSLKNFQANYNRGSALYYLKYELGYKRILDSQLDMLDKVPNELFELWFWHLERYSRQGKIRDGYRFLFEKRGEYYPDLK